MNNEKKFFIILWKENDGAFPLLPPTTLAADKNDFNFKGQH